MSHKFMVGPVNCLDVPRLPPRTNVHTACFARPLNNGWVIQDRMPAIKLAALSLDLRATTIPN
jgi:hypothetical protein